MNTDWIRPGVKAVITNSFSYPNCIGSIVTIDSDPYLVDNIYGRWTAVKILEGWYIAANNNDSDHCFCPDINYIKPYHEPGSWDELQKTIGWSPEREKVNE